jgi:hypothetical protein
MIAQQPSSDRARTRSPEKTRPSGARKTSWFDAKLEQTANDSVRFHLFLVLGGLAALLWVAFVATILLHSAGDMIAVRTPPATAALPSAADASDSTSQTIETVEDTQPMQSGPDPAIADAAREASDEANPPSASMAIPAPASTASHEAPLPPPRPAASHGGRTADAGETTTKSISAPPPPPVKRIRTSTRTFQPPFIPDFYRDMVADKMREAGVDSRLEAKVRSGRQLTKADLASVPRPIIEKLNKQVVAYGQPPLYTDIATTTQAAAR